MRLNQSPSVGNKTKLSQTLKSWFPVLMANIQDLEEIIKEHKVDNPIIDVKSKKEESFSEHASKNKNNIQDKIELYADIYSYSHPSQNNGKLVVKEAYWEEYNKKLSANPMTYIEMLSAVPTNNAIPMAPPIGSPRLRDNI
jgi:DNA-directed RNA polymerase specialized sigma54-like protein